MASPLALAVFVLALALARAHERVDVARLREMWNEYRHRPNSSGALVLVGYVAGVADTAHVSLCVPGDVGARRLVEAVGRFADTQAALRYRSGTALVQAALTRAFPCRAP
jgi:hypothetical protein